MLYLVGTVTLAAVTFDYGPGCELSTASKEAFLGISLLFISVGTGGIKANVSPLGADQLESKGAVVVQRFFDWFYWFIQLGSCLAYTIVVKVQQDVSFFYGYLITALSMFLAIILFVRGRKSYIVHPHNESHLTDTCRILCQGIKKLRFKGSSHPSAGHWLDKTKATNGGSYKEYQVDDVKTVLRVVPIFLTFIIYWTIYGQVRDVHCQ